MIGYSGRSSRQKNLSCFDPIFQVNLSKGREGVRNGLQFPLKNQIFLALPSEGQGLLEDEELWLCPGFFSYRMEVITTKSLFSGTMGME
jgi:hypothetical protein